MIVTEEILEQGKSENGSWGNEQLHCLLRSNEWIDGWKLRKGWKKRLIGSEVPIYAVRMFIAKKNKHLFRKKKL